MAVDEPTPLLQTTPREVEQRLPNHRRTSTVTITDRIHRRDTRTYTHAVNIHRHRRQRSSTNDSECSQLHPNDRADATSPPLPSSTYPTVLFPSMGSELGVEM
jgi:hypothetical protein